MTKTFLSIAIFVTAATGLFFTFTTLSYHQIFAQEEIKQENGSVTQSKIYEGLGIKIKYFDPWEIEDKADDPILA